jgi:hypothetical protein
MRFMRGKEVVGDGTEPLKECRDVLLLAVSGDDDAQKHAGQKSAKRESGEVRKQHPIQEARSGVWRRAVRRRARISMRECIIPTSLEIWTFGGPTSLARRSFSEGGRVGRCGRRWTGRSRSLQ